jgi:hypothetical protein
MHCQNCYSENLRLSLGVAADCAIFDYSTVNSAPRRRRCMIRTAGCASLRRLGASSIRSKRRGFVGTPKKLRGIAGRVFARAPQEKTRGVRR